MNRNLLLAKLELQKQLCKATIQLIASGATNTIIDQMIDEMEIQRIEIIKAAGKPQEPA